MNLPALALDRTVTEALGWTLVHFLWQGCVIAAALCALDVLLVRSRASTRYLAACAAFVMMLIAPAVTFRVLHQGIEGNSGRPMAMAQIELVEPGAVSSAAADGPELSTRPQGALTSSPAPKRPRDFSGLLPWVVQLWVVGVVFLSLRLLGGWWLVRRMMRSPGNATLESLQASMQRLARRMEISQPVRLVRSALVVVPTTIGWLRPMILLPASTLTGLTPAQIEAVLAHELAHIRRFDYLVNLLQSVVEMLLFYHPALWWVSKRIRDERELCCDDLAIRVAGDPVGYARALCELERLRGEAMDLALAATGGSLRTRVARLLGMQGRPWDAATRGMAGVFGVSAVLVLLALGGLKESAGHDLLAKVRFGTPAPVAPIAPVAPVAPAFVEPAARSHEPSVPSCSPVPAAAPAPAEVAPAPAAWAIAPVSGIMPFLVQPAAPAAPALFVQPAVFVQPGAPAPPAAEAPEDVASDDGDAADPSVTRRFSSREWERMRQHGISEGYVRRLEASLPGLNADQLIDLANHGVSSVYVANLRRAGLDRITVEGLIRLANHGVSSAYIRGLEIDPDDLTIDELVRLASNGVTSNWYSAMEWMGLSEFSVDRAIQLRNTGVTPEYANQMKLVSRRRLTLDELTMLRNQGVTADYTARMFALFGSDLDVEHLVRLRNQGVTAEYAEQMKFAVHDGELAVDDLIQLRTQGVEPGYAYRMWRVTSFDARDLIRLRQGGVDADFVEEARKAGYDDPSVSTLIKLRRKGLSAEK